MSDIFELYAAIAMPLQFGEVRKKHYLFRTHLLIRESTEFLYIRSR